MRLRIESWGSLVTKKPKSPNQLPPEQTKLWSKVAETITPLKNRPAAPTLPPRRSFFKTIEEMPLPASWGVGTSPDPAPMLDKKDHRRLTQGRLPIDQTLDLHGMNQDQAYAQLKRRVEMAIKHGNRTLLIVTGKGGKRWSQSEDNCVSSRKRADFDQFGGVLKRMVPLWLSSPELSFYIHSYGPAAKEHGGDGALYVRLRREKRNS